MERLADAPRSLAVHHLDAIGAAAERPIDFFDNPCERFIDGQPMQVDAAGRCGVVGTGFTVGRVFTARLARRKAAPYVSSVAFSFLLVRCRHQIVFAARDRGVFHLNPVVPTASGFDDDAPFLAKRKNDYAAAF